MPRLHRRNLPARLEGEDEMNDDPQLLEFWSCQCRTPDIEGAKVEQRRDGDRLVDVRSCHECWGDVALASGGGDVQALAEH